MRRCPGVWASAGPSRKVRPKSFDCLITELRGSYLRRGGIAGARRRAGYRGIRYVDPRDDVIVRKCMCPGSDPGVLESVPDPNLDSRRGLYGGAHAHPDDLALVLPPLGERLEHGEARGAHLAGLPPQNLRPGGFEPAMELIQAHVIVSDRPALLVEG